MKLSLGIDAGGTYTDAVLLNSDDGRVLQANKALTTYPDLIFGIRDALDGLDQKLLADVRLVCVSTTLATNTILENTGYPVGLILIGKTGIPADRKIEYSIQVRGGHNSAGNEVEPLDIQPVEDFILKVKNKVSAFAVSSYFSVRNPEHELQVKESVMQLTGLPVVCGHELSQDLGVYERGVTAYLNAQLIPLTDQFMQAVTSEIKKRNIEAKLMMLKCDGSMVSIGEALKKPIQSIFSGPAASLLGASHLSGFETCAVVDVGGTSTDVSMMHEGLPEISDLGAVVGKWQTKVKALRMETSAVGGDSHVWILNHEIHIGPRRVIPLCLAALNYPEIKEKLTMQQNILRNQIGENIQPTKFFMRSGKIPDDLSPEEKDLFDRLSNVPYTASDIYWNENRMPSHMTMDMLIQKRLVRTIGFTPTDALHVMGEYQKWDAEAAHIGSEVLSRFAGMEKMELCSRVKEQVTSNIALNLAAFLLEDVDREEINKIISGKFFAGIKVKMPVVLLGGPVTAYRDGLAKYFDSLIVVPQHADVGNAVGALAAKGIKRLEVLVKASLSESKYNIKPKSYIVFYPGGRKEFSSYAEALYNAERIGSELVMDYMSSSYLDLTEVKINISRNDISVEEGTTPLETRLGFLGIGQ
ncbi:MAG: Hydantoinase/oxoprolinase [Methanomethylovorans sp. PtaU1.Bin093]|uniref:hydantoinase/oxoprolinase family protein n=1 Tax=Methanomethylovorans sp. PtaU1.Bin093 TaxID=1811679 RepID=UPI0009D3BCA4|nr:hydantoinase/oxoprolinase family protein [Methanomethylovorans sp. PtaU1.Bin093]OPY21131.1 MAG: Hydantoinase/oxoprolinase [Methanomethylovorans sp. PtaU1.Bin093]